MLNLAQKTCPPFSTFGLGVRDIFVRRSLWLDTDQTGCDKVSFDFVMEES